MDRIKTIFLDVDGTMAAFVEHALDLFDRPDLKGASYPKGVYNLGTVLGISNSEFWGKIDNDLFWRTIPAYEGAHEFTQQLKEYCRKSDIKLYFCTVGNHSPYFPAARSKWLREFAPGVPFILMDTWEDKGLLASHTTLFIDDNDKILSLVRAKGAHAVAVPQMWNNEWYNAADKPEYDKILKQVKEAVNESNSEAGSWVLPSRDLLGRDVCGDVRYTAPLHMDVKKIDDRTRVYC